MGMSAMAGEQRNAKARSEREAWKRRQLGGMEKEAAIAGEGGKVKLLRLVGEKKASNHSWRKKTSRSNEEEDANYDEMRKS